jgi:chromatin segregation and condensation protein Rec8/ScpA/Scc1 (kleisin family)
VLRRLFILRLPRIDRDSKAPQRRVSRQSDLPADLMVFSLRSNYIKRSHPRWEHRMATRVIKLREAEEPAPEMVQEVLSQSKRPEVGRFLLQVDRQTKRSYATAEAAETAGMVIKKDHPIVQVSVYDSVETANKIIELPAGSS